MTSQDTRRDQLSEIQTYADLISSPEKLDQVAGLVARGELPFPTGLAPDQVHRLAVEVRERRRRRLVKFIARSIAQKICRSVERLETEETRDVETTI